MRCGERRLVRWRRSSPSRAWLRLPSTSVRHDRLLSDLAAPGLPTQNSEGPTLRRLKAAGGEVWRAYTLKEAVRGIFEPGLSVEDVTVLIDRLLSRLARSRLEPFVRLGKTIRKHRDGILAAIRLGINQGRTEALNNKVRLITRRAYGFHSADAALALIMLTCGPITLHLPHELHAPGIA